MKHAIIYHRADDDGKLSHAIVAEHMRRNGLEFQSFPWDYGDPTPDLSGIEGDIWMVDISVDEILGNTDLRGRIVWIDHHKSAIEKWSEVNFRGLQYDGMGACRLCWFYTSAEQDVHKRFLAEHAKVYDLNIEPPGVFLVGLRDVWAHKGTVWERDCEHLRLALVAMPAHGEIAAGCDVDQLLILGSNIAAYDRALMAEYSEACHIATWCGLRFLVLNTPGRGSGCLDARSKERVQLHGPSDHDALMVWRFDGSSCRVSLYHAAHRTDLDLSLIATRMGGGGHRGACGFRTTLEQINSIVR